MKFAKYRSNTGSTVFFPVQYFAKDAVISVLPGDDYYPVDPNLYEVAHDIKQFKDKTFAEFLQLTKNVHRTNQNSMTANVNIFANIEPLDGHLHPGGALEVKQE